MKNILVLLFIFTLLAGCGKEDLSFPPDAPADTPPVITSKIKIKWQSPIRADTSYDLMEILDLCLGNPVYSAFGGEAHLYHLDGETGKMIWYLHKNEESLGYCSDYNTKIINDKIAFSNHDYLNIIDGRTGKLEWYRDAETLGGNGGVRVAAYGDYIYHHHSTGSAPTLSSTSMIRTHYLTHEFDTLFTVFSAGDDYYDHLRAPAVWVNRSGDTILVGTMSDVRVSAKPMPPGGTLERTSFYAFNTRTKQMEWQIDNFVPEGFSRPRIPLVEGNFAWLFSKESAFCIDLRSGTIKWERRLTRQLCAVTPVIHGNILFAPSYLDEGIWGLDKYTGATVWHNPVTGTWAERLDIYDGIVYFTGNFRLWAVRADNGKVIWSEPSPNRQYPKTADASFGPVNVIVDKERKCLYTSDLFYFMAIDLAQ